MSSRSLPWASPEPDLGTQPAAVVLVEGSERAYLDETGVHYSGDAIPEMVFREVVQRAGVPHRPEELDITWPEIDAALEALPAFVDREVLWYSFANDLVYGERERALVREALDF